MRGGGQASVPSRSPGILECTEQGPSRCAKKQRDIFSHSDWVVMSWTYGYNLTFSGWQYYCLYYLIMGIKQLIHGLFKHLKSTVPLILKRSPRFEPKEDNSPIQNIICIEHCWSCVWSTWFGIFMKVLQNTSRSNLAQDFSALQFASMCSVIRSCMSSGPGSWYNFFAANWILGIM